MIPIKLYLPLEPEPSIWYYPRNALFVEIADDMRIFGLRLAWSAVERRIVGVPK